MFIIFVKIQSFNNHQFHDTCHALNKRSSVDFTTRGMHWTGEPTWISRHVPRIEKEKQCGFHHTCNTLNRRSDLDFTTRAMHWTGKAMCILWQVPCIEQEKSIFPQYAHVAFSLLLWKVSYVRYFIVLYFFLIVCFANIVLFIHILILCTIPHEWF